MRRTTVKETVVVWARDSCGADLPDVGPVTRERRVFRDIVFEVAGCRVGAEARECPGCRARN